MAMLKLAVLLGICMYASGQAKVLTNDECDKNSIKKPPQCGWFYLAYAPRILRAGVAEKVLVATNNVNFSVDVKAILFDGKKSDKVIVSTEETVKPGVLTELVLKIPIDAPSSGTIKIEGFATLPKGIVDGDAWKFENTTKAISIQKTSRTMFIQTDRPIYKPGESMMLRVVVVDSDLKAVKGQIARVSILNPSQTLVRQWRDVKLRNGVANLKMKLSVKPVLGDWKIQAQMSGLMKTVTVKVEKYVLPKFQVKINPPSYIALGQTKVSGEVCAKYSYGKDVNGFLSGKICAKFPGYWDRKWNEGKEVCEGLFKKIYGCAPFEIDFNSFKIYKYPGYGTIRFTMEASVKERATGITLNATKVEKTVEKTDVKLSFSGTSDIFKPGLPFNAVLLVTRPDGSRADNVRVSVEVSAGWSNKLLEKKILVKNGKANINLPEIPFDAKELRFDASYSRPAIPGSKVSDWKRRSSAYHSSKAWYSPSHSYIGIQAPKRILKVGQQATFNIKYTSVDLAPKIRTVYYTLMCKGYVAHSGSIEKEFIGADPELSEGDTTELPATEPPTKEPPTREPPTKEPPTKEPPATEPPTTEPPTTVPLIREWWWERKTATRPPLPKSFSTGSFDIKVPITQSMSPSCRMLVYFIRRGETVADSQVIDVEDTFANKVSMKFNEEEVFPGAKVKLSLKASPGSVFAISAVDKSVHFLADANDISRGQVTGILNGLDIGPGRIDETSRCGSDSYYWWHYSSSDYVDSQKAFNDNGMIFMSNLLVDSRPCGSQAPVVAYQLIEEPGGPLPLASVGNPGPDLAFVEKGRNLGLEWVVFEHLVDVEEVFLQGEGSLFVKDAGTIFLSNIVVDSRPCADKGPNPVFQVANGGDGGGMVYALPDSKFSGKKPLPKNVDEKPRKPPAVQIRSEFPETWLWTEETVNAKTGEMTIDVKIPDTITTWYASGFAISDSDGLGVANPAEIKGFKALFVSVNLPYAVTRDELVTFPVVVFNYLSECVNAKITLKESKHLKSVTGRQVSTCICGGRTATVYFKAYAKALGRIEIEAKAESLAKNNCPKFLKFDGNTYIDIVRKKLLVEPEGIEKEYTYNSLVCPKDKEVQNNVNLAIPNKIVPGSVFAELRVIGDLMGPSLANIDGLLKMPYGCGEQNMLNFAPNIFIMQYLKATNQLKDEIKQKAVEYTLQGYQRELSYKHPDGSYSAFGDRDKEGSMWLTAFVLKSFAQAREFIDIDKKVMTDAKQWILRKQTSVGCFPTVGTLHHKAMKGGVKTPVTLTGYVVVALLEAGMDSQTPAISRALDFCIKPELNKINDTYSLNILAYTMAKAGRPLELALLLNKLDSLAIRENGNRYWGEPKREEKPRHSGWFYSPYHQAKSTDIEQTAYGLLASMPEGDPSKAVENIDIVRWLSQQRNSLGGWSSTQDTVLAMQALAEFSAAVYGGKVDMTVDVAVPGLTHKFNVNSDNSLVLQRVEIPPKFPAQLKTFARGKGCALLSASVKYNVKDIQEVPAFKLDVEVSPLRSLQGKLKHGRCVSQELNICARWLKEDTSNMAIISVKMLSGFEPTVESLDKAVARDVLLKEYEKKEKSYVFYYSRISKKGVCLKFKIKHEQIVENTQPSSVKVYDYYDTDQSATAMYQVSPDQCSGVKTTDP